MVSRSTAVALKLLSCLLFAAVNSLSRSASPRLPAALAAAVVVFVQNAAAACLAIASGAAGPAGMVAAARSRGDLGLHALRCGSAVAGVSAWYASLRLLSMARGAALGFLGPVVTSAGAVWLLGERLTARRAACVALSTAATLAVTRPDVAVPLAVGQSPAGAALAVLAAALFAAANLASRELARRGCGADAMAAALSVATAPASLVLLVLPAWLAAGRPDVLTAEVAARVLPPAALMGALSHAAHVCTARAYAGADAFFLAPLGVARLVFSGLAGVVLHGEAAEPWPVAVGALALAGVSVALLRERLPPPPRKQD